MDTHETLTDRVQAVLADALRVPREEIGPTTEFGDLPQWDSMGHMEVMVSLEKAFQIEITAETITDLVSIPAICAHLEARDGA